MIRIIRSPFSEARRRRLDVGEIQGDILRGYGLPVSTHLFIDVGTAGGGRAILAESAQRITNGATWVEKPRSTVNVAITHSGLAALGAPQALLDSFPEAFRQGMAARAELLGDTGRADPSGWQAGLGTGTAHVLFTVNAADDDACRATTDELRQSFAHHGATIVSEHHGRRLPDRKEHFGYTDGVGQPAIEGTGAPVRGEGDMGTFRSWHGLPLGEIFHGFVDDDGDPAPGPAEPFGLSGTYKVWRKLYEDVATFRTWITDRSGELEMDETLLRAKLVGRWPDASPLVLTPDHPDPEMAADPERVNDFDYSSDPHGERCPLGAHIRRANPRSSLGFGDALNSRQRIIRRGMTYGEPLAPGAPDDGVDRGIFFVAYMADIERQFEFIQSSWCNDGDAVNVGHDRDPFIGRSPGDHKFVIPGPTPKFVHPLAEPVLTRGGEYLWVPSMSSVRRIAEGRWTPDDEAVASSDATTGATAGGGNSDEPAPIVWTSPGSLLGVALAPIAFVGSYLTGRRLVHPVGVSFDAEVEIFAPPNRLLTGTVLADPGSRPAIVRLSRGFGRPLSRPDVHGFALRLPDADGGGNPQDLLLATVRIGRLGRDSTAFTMRYERTFSTIVRLRVPAGRVLFKVRPRQAMPGDGTIHSGAAHGLRFDLCVGESADDVRVIGVVTLGPARSTLETQQLGFSVTRDAGGIRPAGMLNAARSVVYPAGHLGRARRNAT